MDNQALTPTSQQVVFTNLKKTQNDVFDSLAKDDEDIWAAFGESPFYPRLRSHIEKLISALDGAEDKEFENGATLEQIGLRRMINKLTAANLRSIISKVEKTTALLNERRGIKK